MLHLMEGFTLIASFGAPHNVVFSGALALMALIGVAQVIGVGGTAAGIDTDMDAGAGGDHLLDWLGVGLVPLSILLILFLATFAIIGLVGQQVLTATLGAPLSAWLAAPAAALGALPATGIATRVLAPVLPRDETTAIDIEQLIGRRARIVNGTATAGSPARARAEDRFGQPHYVMVEPNQPDAQLLEGDTILLVARDGQRFRAILREPDHLPEPF